MEILGNTDLIDGPIAAFDLDHTLIRPKSGGTHVSHATDWTWLNPKIKEAITILHETCYRIVIFTNQRGIEKGKRTINDFRHQIDLISADLGFQPTVLVATSNDKWRKPSPHMWWYLRDNYVEAPIDPTTIIYVGDAAGREEDFSDSDIKFAYNCGFQFRTPESFLIRTPATFPLGAAVHLPVGGFDLTEYISQHPVGMAPAPAPYKEMIILVGAPGCGKSTFAHKYFPAYGYVNMDTVNKGKKGTSAQCIRKAKELILQGSVIIDNTNSSPKTRNEYIAIAAFVGAKVRCIWFDYPLQMSGHINECRRVLGGSHVPDVAYAVFRKNFVEPTLAEGFTEVIRVDWIDISEASTETLEVLKMRF